MLNVVQPVLFPAKLEFGQQYKVTYKLVPANITMFVSLLNKDPNVTLKAVVTTSFGESSESEPYAIAELVKNSKYVK